MEVKAFFKFQISSNINTLLNAPYMVLVRYVDFTFVCFLRKFVQSKNTILIPNKKKWIGTVTTRKIGIWFPGAFKFDILISLGCFAFKYKKYILYKKAQLSAGANHLVLMKKVAIWIPCGPSFQFVTVFVCEQRV